MSEDEVCSYRENDGTLHIEVPSGADLEELVYHVPVGSIRPIAAVMEAADDE